MNIRLLQKTKTLALLLFFMLLSSATTQAQNTTLAWAKTMGSTGNDISRSVAVDAVGNIYTTGFFAGTVDFDPNAGVANLTSAGSTDIFVSKLDATGNLVWAKVLGGISNDIGYGIAVDASGNVYTTGCFAGTVDFDPNAGTTNLTSAGGYDIFISKLDASGNFVWAKAMGSTSNDIGYGFTVDASANVYTTGVFAGTVDFDPNAGTTNLTSAGNQDIFVSKLEANGNLVWAKAMGSTTNDIGYGIAVDASGNAYTTGGFSATADFDPNAGTNNLTSAGGADIFVSKLDASGNLVWAKAMGRTTNDIGYGIAVDASGNVYTTGSFQGTVDFDPNAGVSNLTSVGGQDIFVHKMSTPAAALNFDGANDYVGVTAPTNLPIGNSNYTIEAWIKPSALGERGIVGWGNWGVDNQCNAFRLSPTGLVNYWWDQDLTVNYAFALNTWYHVACSFDGTTRTIYVNGVVIGSDTPGVHTVTNTNFRIGSTNNAEYFSGGIDEVRIWNRGLPQAEIVNNMNCELAAGQTGLIAYYQFNQGFDNSNNSAITTLTDASGNVNTGTLNNFALNGTTSNWVAPGGVTTGNSCFAYILANTLNFDNNSDYVEVNDNALLDFGANDFTVEYWVNKKNNDVYGGVNKWNTAATAGSNEWGLILREDGASNNKPNFVFESGTTYYACAATTNLNLNTWYHIAGVREGTNLKIYVNGVLENTIPIGNIAVNNAGRSLLINKLFSGNFTGADYEELRIWSRALPQTEIMNNMNCELPAGQTGLVAYYKFNQGIDIANNTTINTLTDSSGNNLNGTLNGFALTGTTSNWKSGSVITSGNTCSPFLSTDNYDFSSKLSVYPNPSSDVFSINSDTRGEIVVYDLIGKIIKSETIDLGITKLDLSNYPRGIYLMKITNDSNQTKTMKLIKQ
ncbi:Por secretion system C-terminal sorting domain-containing protein [Flavobacterium swingsii]|uniref:Por secretion system C-terminal sorting domain-containing protein n=1 Tax=Flavobacterium swingsii TaxID=498292 RepID=A0A1I0V9D4_9FLAO|nr:LamG-like jellyroll fold domain-containing protein [Flavobacterium swingsii]SFA72941.1 Por secretion system C-terminal sorting domain-containing protein [Flavobacterium swingsii]